MAGKAVRGVKDWADVVIVALQWLTEGNISYKNNPSFLTSSWSAMKVQLKTNMNPGRRPGQNLVYNEWLLEPLLKGSVC